MSRNFTNFADMENNENIVKILEYNTHRDKMALPEYGRGVQKMISQIKTIEDKAKRSEQARAIVRVMEILNPSIHLQENWEQALWDHLYMISDYDLDIDSPYPMPEKKTREIAPQMVPLQKKPIKATHYGRNIESIIDLIAEEEEGEVKNAMIRDLGIYMRTQYLIWNKDSVTDSTIFADIEKLSDGRIKVPEGISLGEVSKQANFSRPGLGAGPSQQKNRLAKRQQNQKGFKKRK